MVSGAHTQNQRSQEMKRDIFQVRQDIFGTYYMVKSEIEGNVPSGVEEDEDGKITGFGWSLTTNAAIKKASSAIFAEYKKRSQAVKLLADIEITESVNL